MNFYVRPPEGEETPVVVEAPHAGLQIDPLAMATMIAPARSIGIDADLYVDELYADAPACGATLLASRVSRYVCDLNRGESDVDQGAVDGGGHASHPHGLIWRTTTEGKPALRAPVPRSEFQRRLAEVYRPYHEQLRQLLASKLERFGYAILLCAHSMPSAGRANHVDPGNARADVVPGSRGYTSGSTSVVNCPELLAKKRGWSVAHDQPYRGGYTTAYYGKPSLGVHAVQVELNRRLYMTEDTLEKKPAEFEATRAYCRELVVALGALPSADLAPA